MQDKHEPITKKQLIGILVVTILLGIGLFVSDYIKSRVSFDGKLERYEVGNGESIEDLEVSIGNQTKDLKVKVSEQKLAKKDINRAFDKAVKEIEATYLGKNKSPDYVSDDLILKDTYANGLISAEWKFDQYGFIQRDGKIRSDEIPDEGIVLGITAILRYEQDERIHSFFVVLMPKSLDTPEGQLEAINREIKKLDANTRDSKYLQLPREVEDIKISWRQKIKLRGLYVIILGIAAVIGIQIGKKRDQRLEKERIKKEKEQDYPLIVSELSVLMGAGMSFRKAIEKISAKYLKSTKEKEGNSRAGFEDIVLMHRKMTYGVSELQAIEELGINSESREYKKLSMLIVQNLRKGSRELIDCLENEEKYAFELRKQNAIRAGEKVSTKLLIPMAGMLFIVIVILVVPAILQMKI